MYTLASLLRLPSSLLTCATLLPLLTHSTPSIDVSLHASFPSPPFLLELLETAATENSSAYYPILSSIASGRFHRPDLTNQQLYYEFEQLILDDAHITDGADLASWRFALATRESAPRIEAQYQLYRSAEGQPQEAAVAGLVREPPAIEVYWEGRPHCDGDSCGTAIPEAARSGPHHSSRDYHFDRISGSGQRQPLYTIYANVLSSDFPKAFSEWRQKHPQDAYRIRYKPSAQETDTPLVVSGYGVELALKRTDYIVIDDREAGEAGKTADEASSDEVKLDDEESVSDLKPLSSSELRKLGLNTASFIMSSDNPFDTLTKIAQDFPKHSSALAQHNASEDFLSEHRKNRDIFLRAGANVMFVNGQQVPPREVDAFELLDIMRRERRLVSNMESLGLSPMEAANLLQHPSVSAAQSSSDVQRYDFRDDIEGGDVILWLNNIEKDKRYSTWSTDINAFLQRMFPGQLPTVKKDTHNVVYPMDFADADDVLETVETMQNFVKRMVPVQFGLVPIFTNENAVQQAKVVYYLAEAYGLAAVVQYLTSSSNQAKLSAPNHDIFKLVVEGSKLRKDKTAHTIDECLALDSVQERINHAQAYLGRLGADNDKPPVLGNGVPIPKDELWMQAMSQQLSADLRIVQQSVYTDALQQSDWIPLVFLNESSTRRDPLLIPEDEKDVKIFNLAHLYEKYAETIDMTKPFQTSTQTPAFHRISIIVFADLNTEEGAQLVLNATEFAEAHDDIEIRFMHQSREGFSTSSTIMSPEGMSRIQEILEKERPSFSSKHKDAVGRYLTGALMSQSVIDVSDEAAFSPLEAELGLLPGERGVLLNGRFIGPLPEARALTKEDFETLLAHERKKRVDPTLSALSAMGLDQYLEAPFAVVKLASIVALSAKSDVPEGIFETSKGPRMNTFTQWDSQHTCITVGDAESAPLQFVVSLDPASDTAQKWLPLLSTVSQLDGVYLRIFLNPLDRLEELPIKRFYRQVLSPSPAFAEDGSFAVQGAHFVGIPEDALLTMSMDVPPSWHVAPKDSIHDLDNIKLSSLQGSSSIEATYELEHIMIEGHSRDTINGSPPRGAQLVLGTENNPNFAATIIMANLGYFQFKANPGVYNLKMQQGASDSIYHLGSAGTKGYSPQAGDVSTEISLFGFKGATIFPRLSRKPGMETADVLEYKSSSAVNLAAKGVELADGWLKKAGLSQVRSSEYIAKGFELGQNVLSMAGMAKVPVDTPKHADINIFSVASGHLYERMLNIMMLSVMRHTNHTVKFWFIEQFLSPSFKTFLPAVAAEYGFEFEMVAFKWPHWLRAQTEKQRMIWGYKILFLDVLFPLDLDKVIFVDADQIVRTDMYDLVQHDLEGAPYGFTPMCDSRTEMEGYRFWKQGYWKNFLRGLPYHISALYVVDLKRFRAIAAGDRLRQQYQSLSADPNSLSNLDQDLPNHMQMMLPIHSLPQEWLWCETWCSDAALKEARTIDLCNNPETHEPKLDRARRQVPEWTVYDDEIAALARRTKGNNVRVGGLTAEDNPAAGEAPEQLATKDEL